MRSSQCMVPTIRWTRPRYWRASMPSSARAATAGTDRHCMDGMQGDHDHVWQPLNEAAGATIVAPVHGGRLPLGLDVAEMVDTPVCRADEVDPGSGLSGPAIIRAPTTTMQSVQATRSLSVRTAASRLRFRRVSPSLNRSGHATSGWSPSRGVVVQGPFVSSGLLLLAVAVRSVRPRR